MPPQPRRLDRSDAHPPEAQRERLRDLLRLDAFSAAEGAAELVPAQVGAAASEPAVSEPAADGGVSAHPAPSEATLVTASGDEIPAFLLRPDPSAATGAAAVLVAGHGRGIDDLVRLDPACEYHDGLAHKLVRAGVTVLCPEMVGFGRRRVPQPEGAPALDPAESTCGIDAARYLLHGTPVMGRRVADALVAADALRRLPGVDPERVAIAGGSGGGAVALLAAAVEPSIAAALVATYFSSFAASIASIRHCPCNIIPGLLPGLEMADIAALIAPRPLVIEAGEQDRLFPIAAARAAFAQLPPVWEAAGAVPPELVVTEGGHSFRAERSLEALLERLG